MHARIVSYDGAVLQVKTVKGKQSLSCLKRKLDNVILEKDVMIFIHYPTGVFPEVVSIYNTDISRKNAEHLSVKLISMAGDN